MSLYKLNKNNTHLESIKSKNFKELNILEEKDLRPAIANNIECINSDFMIISEEFSDWEDSRRKIDILAIDKQGNIIVIELKRTNTGDHMELQALRYSAMISTITLDKIISTLSFYQKITEDEAKNLINDHLESNEINNDVKIILISNDFSSELITSVLWLNDKNLNIECFSLRTYSYKEETLINIEQIVPLKEAKDYQIKLKQQKIEKNQNKYNKDYTKYIIKNSSGEVIGSRLAKNRTVLFIIQDYIKNNADITIKNLNERFPTADIRKDYKLFIKHDELYSKNTNGTIRRYFTKEDQVLYINNIKYLVCNQWSGSKEDDNLFKFFKIAKELGYDIQVDNSI